ncbi:hypothetical protein KIPB_013678, partial [Kipferlia bialata]|eukprot:g13678.t1
MRLSLATAVNLYFPEDTGPYSLTVSEIGDTWTFSASEVDRSPYAFEVPGDGVFDVTMSSVYAVYEGEQECTDDDVDANLSTWEAPTFTLTVVQ